MPISCILKLPLQIKRQIHPSQIQSPQQKTDFNFIVLNKFGNLNWSWRANFNHRASFCFTDRLSPTLQLWSLTRNSRLSRSWGGHWGRTQMNWEEELQSVANQRHSHELFSKGFYFFFLPSRELQVSDHEVTMDTLKPSGSSHCSSPYVVIQHLDAQLQGESSCVDGIPLPLTPLFYSYLRITTSWLQNHFLFHLLFHFFYIIKGVQHLCLFRQDDRMPE